MSPPSTFLGDGRTAFLWTGLTYHRTGPGLFSLRDIWGGAGPQHPGGCFFLRNGFGCVELADWWINQWGIIFSRRLACGGVV